MSAGCLAKTSLADPPTGCGLVVNGESTKFCRSMFAVLKQKFRTLFLGNNLIKAVYSAHLTATLLTLISRAVLDASFLMHFYKNMELIM